MTTDIDLDSATKAELRRTLRSVLTQAQAVVLCADELLDKDLTHAERCGIDLYKQAGELMIDTVKEGLEIGRDTTPQGELW